MRLIASENYASRAVLEATRLGAHQQVLRGLRRTSATTRASRSSTRSRARGHRAPEEALRRRSTSTCSPTRGSPANLAVYLAFCQPDDPVHGPRPAGGRSPHARLERQHHGQVLQEPALRRASRRPPHRHGRGARARARAPAEAHLVRHHGLSAHPRLRRSSARSPTRSEPSSPPTSRTSPASSPAACIRRRSASPTSSPAPRTRPSAVRAAA